jgi:hypothetical protein
MTEDEVQETFQDQLKACCAGKRMGMNHEDYNSDVVLRNLASERRLQRLRSKALP